MLAVILVLFVLGWIFFGFLGFILAAIGGRYSEDLRISVDDAYFVWWMGYIGFIIVLGMSITVFLFYIAYIIVSNIDKYLVKSHTTNNKTMEEFFNSLYEWIIND